MKLKVAGLTFNQRGNNSVNYKSLRLPIGIDLQFGNNVDFIIGGGIINSILLSHQGLESTDFLDSKRDFQIISEINTGMGVHLNKKISLSLSFQNNFDLTKVYEVERMSPGGASYTDGSKGRDGFLSISIRSTIKKE